MCAMREEERRKKFITTCGAFILLLRVCAFALDGTPGHITASNRRTRLGADFIIKNLLPHEFRRSFRMGIQHVQELFGLVRPSIVHMECRGVASCGSAISPEARLLMALQWLAGGACRDIMLVFGISKEARPLVRIIHDLDRELACLPSGLELNLGSELI